MADENTFYDRLTRLFRSGPAIRRKVKGQNYKNFYDTAVVQNNLGYFGASSFKREASPFSIMGAYGILDRQSRYAEFCFAPETLVYTVDKGVKSIKELSEECPEEIFHVWSYDHNKGEISIATAHHPRVTKDGVEQALVEVVFDDGGSLRVTEDHKFLLRDGSYTEARNLKPNDSLMPFYVRKVTGNYHQVYMTRTKREAGDYGWEPEHKLVAEYLAKRKLLDTETVHHIDFDPENNTPNNLRIMDALEHKRFHSKLNNKNKFNKRNSSHSKWMKLNNPVKRVDVTFSRIFDVAQLCDFSMSKTSKALGADSTLLKHRLREEGFDNWVEFRNSRGILNKIRTCSRVLSEMQPPSLEAIMNVASSCQTIYEASRKLGCTDNVLRKSIKRLGLGTWSEVKGNVFGPGRKSHDSALDTSLTYQMVCSAYSNGDTKKSLAAKLNTTPNKILTRIEREGFSSFSEWTDTFENHKVSKINLVTEKSVVYNLTVDGNHNVAVGSVNMSDSSSDRPYSMVIAAQSEMEMTPEIATALDLYADESCASDEAGKSFHVHSDNPQIQRALEELFYEVANIEFDDRRWYRNLVKNGDFLMYVEVVPDYGVVKVEPIPVDEIDREEGFDPQDPYAVRFKLMSRGGKYLENWQVLHFRIVSNDLFLPFGTSFLEPARRIWRQLIMMEDAMLVYRVVRSPERRVFYIDTSAIHPNDIPTYMEAVKETLRGQSAVDKLTGRQDIRYNPISIDDDYFLPSRPNSQTKIESLAGGQHVSATEDVEYIQKKLIAALKVPRAYLTFDENISSKATLAQEDIRFSRTIANLQRIMLAELNKLAIIHLFAKGFDGEDLLDFEIKFSNPSTVAIQQKLALVATRIETAGKALEIAKETGIVDFEYIQREILGFRLDDIVRMRLGAQQDQIRMAELKALGSKTPNTNKDEESVVDPFSPSNYQIPASTSVTQEAEPASAPQTAKVSLPASSDGKPVSKYSVPTGKAPVRANPSPMDVAKRKASRKITNGAYALSMPNFKKMLDPNNRYAKDVFDTEFIKNPLQELLIGEVRDRNIPVGIARDLQSSLRRLNEVFQRDKQVVEVDFVSEATEQDEDELARIDKELRDLEK